MSYKMTHAKYLSAAEQAKLADNLKLAPERDRLLIDALLATGCRINELLRLTAADLYVTDDGPVVYIHGNKGSYDRELPLETAIYSRMLAAANENGGKCFVIGYQRAWQIWHQYNPTTKKLHATRHTFAINLLKKCKDIKMVQKALGHVSILNTMVYSDLIIETTELRKAMF